MPKKPSKKHTADAIKALNSVRRDWLRRSGVSAVDVGFKISNGKMTDELALRMHVRRKLPREALPKHEAVSDNKDHKIAGFPVDVVEAEYAPSAVGASVIEAEAVDRKARVDPLVGGVSCGNPRSSAGTIGAIVFDRESGDACILSNWHVLVASPAAVAGEAIWQPGRYDGGTDADTVASLIRFRLDRDMDAALARLDGSRAWVRDLLELQPIAGIDQPELGMEVRKSGRTTGLTEGIIDGISLSANLNYGEGVVQLFQDQIHIVPRPPWPNADVEISMGGNSGSVWINEENGNAVGLHFAGETSAAPSDEHAIANRIGRVAEGLNFSFKPVFRKPPPVSDDQLREMIRRILCRRYPQFCSPWPAAPGSGESAAAPAGRATGEAAACGTLAEAAGSVNGLIDEIVAAVRQAG